MCKTNLIWNVNNWVMSYEITDAAVIQIYIYGI